MSSRTSALWTLPSSEFAALVARSQTFTEVLAYFGLPNRGHNHRTLRRRLDEEGIDTAHFAAHRHDGPSRAYPLAERLQPGTPSPTSYLRRRLLREGVLEERCALCRIGPTWNEKPLTLQLDHINGDRTDNQLENLRLLCPNCHSQTPTFAGRKPRAIPEPRRHPCTRCGSPCSIDARHCPTCHGFLRRTVERPDVEALQRQVNAWGFRATGRHYGVSDNAIRKWLRGKT